MKKWILIILTIIILVVTWQLISIYHSAMSPIRADIEEASQIAKTEENLHTISEVYTYNGTIPYTIVRGMNDEEEDLLIWINDQKEIVLTVKADEGIPKEDVMKYVDTDRTLSEVISVTLAMENEIPLWEVKFKDQDNRINLYYIKFSDGDYYQRITF